MRQDAKMHGEIQSQAVHQFLLLERSLFSWGRFQEFSDIIEEYFELNHAKMVPAADLEKPSEQVFYLPVHVIIKESTLHH